MYQVRIEYVNAGHLNSAGSEQAVKNKIASRIKVGIGRDVKLISGKYEYEQEALAGYHKDRAEWVIEAEQGDKLNIYVKSERAGILKQVLIINK